MADVSEHLDMAADALAAGRWQDAADLYDQVLGDATADSRDQARAAAGRSDASWWLGTVQDALEARRMAYELWREVGADDQAARAAIWLAREYLGALGNEAAARGWVTRAETLAGTPPAADIGGWIELTRAALSPDQAVQVAVAERCVAAARDGRDGDLEALSLARLGLGLVTGGDLDGAVAAFGEAMAIATGGESSLQTLGNLCCDLVLATELWGDVEPFAQWNEIVMRIAAELGHPPLVAFCATCCAEVFSASGDWSGAEDQLRQALDMLRTTEHHARCVSPTARLGELLVLQGRLEEAQELLADDRSEDTLVARARLVLAQGKSPAAVTLLERAWRRLGGDSLLTVPILALLADAHLAADHLDKADDVATRLEDLAQASGNDKVAGHAALARSRVEAATGDRADAVASLERALDCFYAAAPGAIEVAEAHLDMARLRAPDAGDVAVIEAKAAVTAFDTAGATRKKDEAAALLRSLGDRSRVGPKGVGVLTQREQEVMRLLAQGLTNAELAERLFISPKTAGNHVSNILMKLGLRSRAEVAAYAARNQG